MCMVWCPKGEGIYFHKILDDPKFRWIKPIRFPDGDWRGYHGGIMCAWDHMVYFVGGEKFKVGTGDDIWTLDMRYYKLKDVHFVNAGIVDIISISSFSKLLRSSSVDNCWKRLDATMSVPRRDAAVAAVEGKIYVFGGSRPYERGGDWKYEIYDTGMGSSVDFELF